MKHARCPACETLFRVTPEQLEARGGRVRCGQCAHVFNALEEGTLASAGPGEAPTSAGPMIREQWPGITGTPPAVEHAEPGGSQDAPVQAAQPAFEAMTEPLFPEASPTQAEAGPEESQKESPEPIAAVTAPTVESEPLPLPAVEPAPATPQEAAPAPEPVVADWADDRPDILLPPAPGQGNRGWGIAFALLLLTGSLQSIWVFRSQLAMALPETRPALVEVCESLGCDMPLPREPSQIGIEGSELRPSPLGGALLKLSTTLRNRAAYGQAYPHLEVTLTDTDDKVLARKVVAPADYLAPKVSQAAGFPATSDLPLSLTLDPTSLTPTGYRLYVFYP